jgi:hypothetical protein
METWIAMDRVALKEFYKGCLNGKALPSLQNMESRERHTVQTSLTQASRNCAVPYTKDKHSFALLGCLDPNTLKALPSFARMVTILSRELQSK